jgi:IS5 family transposase
MLESPDGWHNVFYHEVVSQIDEMMYSELYDQRMGRPNASVRILIGMMILKEGQGWSDEQLFEECRFNLKIMRALGLSNMDDDIPVESTYYEFRKLLGDYYAEQQRDLLKETFIKITTRQVEIHGASGKRIRLDSKLINSNIARSGRLDLIVEAVRKYVGGLNLDDIRAHFDEPSYELLESLQHKSTTNITYPLNAQQKRVMLISMGAHIRTFLALAKGRESPDYKLLERIYKEQYDQVIKGNDADEDASDGEVELPEGPLDMGLEETPMEVIVPKAPKDISSSSVQSIHDPEAAYRTKGQGASKQTVAGYHVNITESCDPEEKVHLILDVDVVPANVSEDAFLVDAINASQQIIDQVDGEASRIEEVITDGGYDSIENRKKMLEAQNPIWSMSKMKGGRRVYQMEKNDAGELEVYNIESGEQLEVKYSHKAQKYVIKSPSGTDRYMTPKQIENYIQRQQIEDQVNTESHNLRATVESTIHQTFHRLKKNNKIVYRGLIKCQWYVLSRAFWVNIIRITDKTQRNLKNTAFYLILTIGTSLKALILNGTLKICHQTYLRA